MKKLCILLAILLLVCLLATCSVFASAESVSAETAPLDMQPFIEQLCELNGTNDGGQIRDFLLRQFRAVLGESNVIERYFADQEQNSGYNIEGFIDVASTEQCVVIGAHYDAVGEGANDNAAGIAVLFETMKLLYAQRGSLPCDILFVAFDLEEEGLVGSTRYVESQLHDKTETHGAIGNDDVLLMFNIDSIALGDNLYLMCENKHTDIADLILSHSDMLTEKPYAKGVYGELDSFGYGYYEAVQGSDHTPFRLNDIPTALFFSGNYGILGYSDGSGVMNTSSDTYSNLIAKNPDYAKRIDSVANTICDTLTDTDFAAVAQNARKQLVNNRLTYNRWWPALVVLGVLVILAVFTWLYHRKLQKKAILGTGEVKSDKIFDKPQAEDIFSFDNTADGENGKDTDDDLDGIFTFKK